VIILTKTALGVFYNIREVNKIKGVIIMQTFAKVINVPDYQPREKHPTILNGFDSLKSGEFMQIVNDHDPKPLHYQFMIEKPDQFTWEYLEQGPETWRVAIGKK
jgi:uncharacterized protein (DUF2249 family)